MKYITQPEAAAAAVGVAIAAARSSTQQLGLEQQQYGTRYTPGVCWSIFEPAGLPMLKAKLKKSAPGDCGRRRCIYRPDVRLLLSAQHIIIEADVTHAQNKRGRV